MKAIKIVVFVLALSALVLFLAWAKGWVGHLQDPEDDEVYVQAVARRMPNGWTVYTNEGGRCSCSEERSSSPGRTSSKCSCSTRTVKPV